MYHGSFLLPGSMFALDVLGGTIQETGLGFDEGDADRRYSCPSTARWCPVPWREGEGIAQVRVLDGATTTAHLFMATRATCWPMC